MARNSVNREGSSQTVVFIGAGPGPALDEQLKTVRALVLEPDPAVARELLARPDWTSWTSSGRLAVLVGPDYAGAAAAARKFRDLPSAPVRIHPALERDRPADVARAKQALTQIVFQASANENARKASVGRQVLQTLANLPRLAREGDAAALTGQFRDVPGIIVAAGPSLDRNVHDLAPVLDRAIVIACDTAARPLLSIGIEPDFIVATDSSRANAAHLTSLPPARSWLVAEPSLHPSAFVHFDDRTFTFRVANHQPWPWLRDIGLDRALLETWGSVATTALSLAIAGGANPILFAGADFAFTGGRPYCRGTSFEPLWASWTSGGSSLGEIWRSWVERWPEEFRPDLRGQPARTAPHLVSFRDWIVEKAAAHPDRQVINATGAGLLVGAAIRQSSAIDTLGAFPPLDRASITERIRLAHQRSRGDLAGTLAAAGAMLQGANPSAIDAWIEFGAPSVTRPAIAAALRSPELVAWTLGQRRHVAAGTSGA
jgi:hypothetical protein